MIPTDARAVELLVEAGVSQVSATAVVELIAFGRDRAVDEVDGMLKKMEAMEAQVAAVCDERDSLQTAIERCVVDKHEVIADRDRLAALVQALGAQSLPVPCECAECRSHR